MRHDVLDTCDITDKHSMFIIVISNMVLCFILLHLKELLVWQIYKLLVNWHKKKPIFVVLLCNNLGVLGTHAMMGSNGNTTSPFCNLVLYFNIITFTSKKKRELCSFIGFKRHIGVGVCKQKSKKVFQGSDLINDFLSSVLYGSDNLIGFFLACFLGVYYHLKHQTSLFGFSELVTREAHSWSTSFGLSWYKSLSSRNLRD